MDVWTQFFETDDPRRRISRGNRIEHFGNDNRSVRALWEAIDQAERSIWMTMYIFEPDEVGHRTVERLAAAAKRGCRILLLYDGLGSYRLNGKHLAPLPDVPDAHVAIFNRVWPPWKKSGQLAIRNHRKLLVVDGTTAFCGGMNLSEEFAGDDYGEWVFDDTMARLTGPCVRDFADVFMRTWHEVTGESYALPKTAAPHPDGVPVEVLETDPRRPSTQLRETIAAAISKARERCLVTSPYFIPAGWMLDALCEAADHGADVRVLTASETDARIARAAGRHCYGTLFEHGVRIYERTDRILHSKTLTVDGSFGIVGSYNMDLWTSKHTLDLSFATVDPALAEALEREFEDNLDHAREMMRREWNDRGPLKRLSQRAALGICKAL